SLAHRPASPADVGHPLRHCRVRLAPRPDGEAGEGEIVVAKGGRDIPTGDLGRIDPSSGRLYVKGRIDDLINVSGYKVMPSEVEAVIAGMPGIVEAVVYKSAHPVQGEAVRAMAVAHPGVTAKEVRAWCMAHLPSYKVPGAVRIVGEIPRLPGGKISRKYIQT